jgi:hypothetical protein
LKNNKYKTMQEKIDWALFDDAATESFVNHWDFQKSYPENLLSLFSRMTALPQHDMHCKIAISYLLAHSVACRFLPIMLFYGGTGTGKSLATYALACLREQQNNIVGSSSTFASIRNSLNSARWRDFSMSYLDTDRSNERPYILCIADVKEFVFNDDKMYALFRNGVSRDEDKITIAGKDGMNLNFFVFGGKILSTADAFFLTKKFDELKRRLLIMPTVHISELPQADRERFENDSLNPSDINWNGIGAMYHEYWSNDRLASFAKIRRQHGNMKKKAIALGMTEHQFKASFDVIATALACCLFESTSEALELFCTYWQSNSKYLEGNYGLGEILQSAINEVLAPQLSQIADMKALGIDVPVSLSMPGELFQQRLNSLRSGGTMFTSNNELIVSAMGDLGWKQQRRNATTFWVRA